MRAFIAASLAAVLVAAGATAQPSKSPNMSALTGLVLPPKDQLLALIRSKQAEQKEAKKHTKLFAFTSAFQSMAEQASNCTVQSQHCDWAEKKVFGNIRDQTKPQGCGSCYVFGAAGAFESSWVIARYNPRTKQFPAPIEISEQRILNCRGSCKGGDVSQIFDYLYQYGDVDASPTGPDAYAGKVETPCIKVIAPYRLFDWNFVDNDIHPSVSAIKKAILEHGPVVAAMYASDKFGAFRNVKDDHVWSERTQGFGPDSSNHVVVITGWDDDKIDPNVPGLKGAWRIRNSWGLTFGKDGYAWVDYNKAPQFAGSTTNNIGYIVLWADAVTPSPQNADLFRVMEEVVTTSRKSLSKADKALLNLQ